MTSLALVWTWMALSADAGGYSPRKPVARAYEAAIAAGQQAVRNPAAGLPEAITAGRTLYQERCAACHGPTGRGDGPAAAALDPRPADFTDAARWAYTSDGVKRWIMEKGVAGTGMVPLGLTEQDAWNVLAYLEATFQPGAPPGGG